MLLNIISIFVFIFYRTKFELTATVRQPNISKSTAIRQQVLKYKSIIISTITIIVLEIPRFIIIFTLACIEYDWQRYLHLTGYLLSLVPFITILFIYIVPSPKYKKQLKVLLKKIVCTRRQS